MLINHTKTKEMILGNAKVDKIPALFIEGKKIGCLTEFKLLGVHISDDFCLEIHVNALCNKESSKLYFLKLLKQFGVGLNDLLYFYTTVIQSILEYACTVCNHNLTAKQSDKIESLQKWAPRIICSDLAVGMPYNSLLFLSTIKSLKQRVVVREILFLICQETSCLHYLLPDKCNTIPVILSPITALNVIILLKIIML